MQWRWRRQRKQQQQQRGAANVVPIANAGANQTVTSGTTVTLNGTASSDSDGTIASYAWTQTAGTAVTLSSATASQPTFPAPTVASATALTFSLVVTDNPARPALPSTMTVTVNPAAAGKRNVTGNITFARVPFATQRRIRTVASDYATPVQQPARGVIVRAARTRAPRRCSPPAALTISATTRCPSPPTPPSPSRWSRACCATHRSRCRAGTCACRTACRQRLPTPITDPAQFQFQCRHRAQRRDSHRHQCRRRRHGHARLRAVRDARHHLPGHPDRPRRRADHQFPRADRRLGQPGRWNVLLIRSPQHIALMSDLAADTDEFDQHVIAHEFGHYIEYNFSRADNIGGSHGLGDKLDPRVAFGEGFGYAFAAIVLNDPVARDSANDNGDSMRPALSTSKPIRRPRRWARQRQLRLLVQRVVGVVDPLGSLRQRGRCQRQRRARFPPIWERVDWRATNHAGIHHHLHVHHCAEDRAAGATRAPSTRWSPRRTSTPPASMRSAPAKPTCPRTCPRADCAAAVHDHHGRWRCRGRAQRQ